VPHLLGRWGATIVVLASHGVYPRGLLCLSDCRRRVALADRDYSASSLSVSFFLGVMAVHLEPLRNEPNRAVVQRADEDARHGDTMQLRSPPAEQSAIPHRITSPSEAVSSPGRRPPTRGAKRTQTMTGIRHCSQAAAHGQETNLIVDKDIKKCIQVAGLAPLHATGWAAVRPERAILRQVSYRSSRRRDWRARGRTDGRTPDDLGSGLLDGAGLAVGAAAGDGVKLSARHTIRPSKGTSSPTRLTWINPSVERSCGEARRG